MLAKLMTILTLWLSFGICAQVEDPNVLFILCDDLVDLESPILLNNNVHTPTLDSLRAIGVDFSNAVANSPICAPSRASMFTGIYPHNSGYHGYNMEFDPVKDNETLAQATDIFRAFSEADYDVSNFGKIYHGDVFPDPNTKLLIDNSYESERGPWARDGQERKGHSSYPEELRSDLEFSAFPLSHLPAYSDSGWFNTDLTPFNYISASQRDSLGDEKVTNRAISRLDYLSDEDILFFMSVGYRRPHTPYYVPEEYYDLYPLEEIDISHIDLHDLDDVSLGQKYNRSYGISGFKSFSECLSAGQELQDSTYWIKHYIRGYFASVSFIDHEIGRLIQGLQNAGLNSETYVVITSDHGIHLGDKLSFHKNTLWSNCLQIPLIVCGPGVASDRIETKPVSLIDFFPTMIELCGLDSTLNGQLDGHSLVPLLDSTLETNWGGPAFTISSAASNEIISSSNESIKSHQNYALSVGDFRYILSSSGEDELYLNFDPMDQINFSDNSALSFYKDNLHDDLIDFLDIDIENDVSGYFYYGTFEQDLNGWSFEQKSDTSMFYILQNDSNRYLHFQDPALKEDVLFRNQHVRLDPTEQDYMIHFRARSNSSLQGDAFRIKLEYIEKSFATDDPCSGHTEVLVHDYELTPQWSTYSTSFSIDMTDLCDGEFRFTLIPMTDEFELDDIDICLLEEICDGDCGEFLNAPVELSKNTDPKDGISDRVRLKWYKAAGKVRFAIEDSASCDIQFWPVKDLTSGISYQDPTKSMLSQKYVRKPHKELYKWPLRFTRPDIEPNHRYRWRVRCYCNLGRGIGTPWSETKYFNTPPFDPETGIFYPDSLKSNSLQIRGISLYPNPSNGIIHIDFEGKKATPMNIQVLDLAGRIIRELPSNEALEKIDLSNLPEGIYSLRIRYNGQFHMERFVLY